MRPVNHGDKADEMKEVLAKRAYTPPVLLEYGSLAKLTQTGTAGGNDETSGKMNPCL